MDFLRQILAREIAMIKGAPWSFAMCLGSATVIVAIALWYVFGFIYSVQIGNLTTIIQVQGAELSAYRQNTNSPTGTKDYRHLDQWQVACLRTAIRDHKDLFPKMIIYAVARDEEKQYAKQFKDVFESVSILVVPRPVEPNAAEDVGVLVGVQNVNAPSDEAKQFSELLTKCKIDNRFTNWNSVNNLGMTFDLFIESRPW